MLKSELVQRITTHNPHFYQRDIETTVNAILGEITAAIALRCAASASSR
jgi:nucleoid DNA-binding protein